MNIKRIIILSLAMLFILSFSGCTDAEQAAEPKVDGMLAEVDPELYRGTTVTYVVWKNPEISEDGVAVDSFEETYGIQVKFQLVAKNEIDSIVADIAAEIQGDIYFDQGNFPKSLSILQPLNAAKLDLADPFWNQSIIKASTLDGYPYLIDAVSNIETEIDLCVYNKRIFKENKIKSPKEYYDEGKWTFDNFYLAAKEVSKLGKKYTGVGILDETVFGAAGSSFFAYKNNRLVLSMEPRLMETMDLFAKMKTEGIAKLDRKGFQEGMQGMAFTNCHGLKKIGYFTAINPNDLGATYLPVWNEGDKPQITAPYRGWGSIEGAKNPVAAGLFLRHLFDGEEHDLSHKFHSQEVADFFLKITDADPDNILYHRALNINDGGAVEANCLDAWDKNSPAELDEYFASETERMNKMIEEANKIIEEERAWIREAESTGFLP